ncbi:MAG: cob(I)yrinic acid a,c-diamide adenosyltransferase [Halobacteriales archaeon]
MRIYTGRGDRGETDLYDRTRISKASPVVEAAGAVDEVNALVGTILPTGHADVDDRLRRVQHHLHVVQAELANPATDEDDPAIEAAHVERLEAWIDAADEELEPLRSFVLPGGFDAGARLHLARTVCRRAERRVVALAEESDRDLGRPVAYLNRLSDLLFTIARQVNAREGYEERPPSY